MDVHEEDYLDLPELNRQKIEDNRYDIVQNRIVMAGMCGLIFAVALGSHVVTRAHIETSMHECEDRLYEKITGQKIERDLFVEVTDVNRD